MRRGTDLIKKQGYKIAWESDSLTLIQKVLLEYIYQKSGKGKRLLSATIEDISEAIGVSRNTIAKHLYDLEEKGFIGFWRKRKGKITIMWLTHKQEIGSMRFFDAYLSAEARAFLLLMYRIVKGRQEGIYFHKIYSEVFSKTHRSPKTLIRELERNAFIVGRYRGSAYVYGFIEELPFHYKDVPMPEELNLEDNPSLYGIYTSMFLVANADRTTLYPVNTPNRHKLIKELIQRGYLERLGWHAYLLKVVPEEYKRLFIV